ncbi:aldo/keto reductase [Actinomadura sp. CNU-125]|uniref:aldo/keto reductase n=1 Tax=Actinomadura sp. CNU-125 TaxID=1904961 RepID=UPI002916E91C|nr:aldo/keto reductase [Actinomadura sp. CNU-125]
MAAGPRAGVRLEARSLGLVSEQCLYNLAERNAEQEVIPAARAYGLAVLPWSPLHGGMLAGVLAAGSSEGKRRHAGRGAHSLLGHADQVRRFEHVCAQHGLAPAEVSLAWLISRPEVTAPVIGPRTVEQLESALRAIRLRLPDSLTKELEEIFPGPGPAPESFAW